MRAGRMLGVARKNLSRLGSDERGVVMFYTAVVTCFVLALFSLIHDVAVLSEEKVQMQNAADAAAMEMAVWQARGMNVVQNINDEIYELNKGIVAAYITASAMSYGALALYFVPVVGPALATAAKLVAAGIAYIARVIRLTAVEICLTPLRFVYARGAVALGYAGANRVARENRAEEIGPGLYAVGLPAGTLEGQEYRLPLSYETSDTLPLNWSSWRSLPVRLTVKYAFATVNQFIQPGGTWFWLWNDGYYESPDDVLPRRWVWVVRSERRTGMLSRYFLDMDGEDGMPVIAVASAQAKGGNVVMRNVSDSDIRPDGWGVAGDAVLVPVTASDDFTAPMREMLLH